MKTLARIAVRNLLKNRRRSFYAVLAIALGFAAVNVFGGFTRYINASLRDGFIYSMGYGHLTIFREGFLDQGLLDPGRYLLTESQADSVTRVLREQPEVLLVTPQLYVSGILSNGEVSTIFIADGRIPSDLQEIASRAQGAMGLLTAYEGRPLRDEVDYGIGVTTGLAKLLDLGVGGRAVAIATTVEGQINALDAEVYQKFESPIELLNDKMVVVPLEFAKSLYDTRSVDRLTVLLRETRQTEPVEARLARIFAERGMPMEMRTWDDLSVLYRKVRKMFDIIFLFLFVIVLVISVMSVVNTVNMAVMERIREIGTLRALGMRRARIVWLFALESGILGVIGSILGALLTLASWIAVSAAKPTWIPPMITQRIPLEIRLVPEYMLIAFAFLLVLSVAAACVPARRAVREGIVDALGHV
jgi:putative ABC transport system permease protein